MRVWKKKLLRRFDLSTTSVQSYKFPCHFQKNIQKTTNKNKNNNFHTHNARLNPNSGQVLYQRALSSNFSLLEVWSPAFKHLFHFTPNFKDETQQFKLFGRINTLKVATRIHVISLHPLHMMMKTTISTMYTWWKSQFHIFFQVSWTIGMKQ